MNWPLFIFFLSLYTFYSFPHSLSAARTVFNSNCPTPSPDDSLAGLKKILNQSAHEFIRIKQWDRAIETYKQYIDAFPDEKERIVKIIKILQEPESKMKVENLGDSINTKYNEYYPIITADGNSLYFTARHRPNGLGGEDVWASRRTKDGWSKAVNLGAPINTKDHEGFMCLSADSMKAFLFGNYPESFGKGDIFYWLKRSF